MKKYLGIALFFLLVSVLVSIKHQKYADDAAANGGNQSLPVSSVNAPATKGETKGPEDRFKTWWDGGYLFFGWPNGITVLALILTMVVIAEQTAATRNAAQAAIKQVDASHDGQRAWVGVIVRENIFPTVFHREFEDKINDALKPRPPRFEWEFTNCGETPAFVKGIAIANAAHTSPDGGRGQIGNPLGPMNSFVGPGKTETNPLGLPSEALSKVENGEMFWRVTIKITYDDAFGRKGHETMASYHYYVPKTPDDPIRRGFYQDLDPVTNYNT